MGSADESAPLLRRIMNRFSVYKGEPIIRRTARNRDICCIERLADIDIIIAVLFWFLLAFRYILIKTI